MTRVVSPYGGPVITGKPGILLAHPRFPPYAVGLFHVHGAPAYGRYPTGGLDVVAGLTR